MTRSLVVEYAKGTPPSRKIATPLALGDVVACLPGDTNFSIDVSADKAVNALDPRLTRCRASTKRRPPSMLDSLTHRVALGLAVAACLAVTAGTAVADKCTAAKLKAIGKKESGLLACQAAVDSAPGGCLDKANGRFVKAFDKVTGCTGDGQDGAVETRIDDECVGQQVVVDGGGHVIGICPTTTTTTTTTTSTSTTTTTILCGNNSVDPGEQC